MKERTSEEKHKNVVEEALFIINKKLGDKIKIILIIIKIYYIFHLKNNFFQDWC